MYTGRSRPLGTRLEEEPRRLDAHSSSSEMRLPLTAAANFFVFLHRFGPGS